MRSIKVLAGGDVVPVLTRRIGGGCHCLDGNIGFCIGCEKVVKETRLKKCSSCQMAQYCSKECQKLHWKRNRKTDCKEVAKIGQRT